LNFFLKASFESGQELGIYGLSRQPADISVYWKGTYSGMSKKGMKARGGYEDEKMF